MARVKSGIISKKRRKNLLKDTKGFMYGRKSKFRAAHEAILHAGDHAVRGRKEKKRTYRCLWQVKINAFAREHDMNYSTLIKLLKDNQVEIDRKILAQLCEEEPQVMEKILLQVKK